MYEGAELTLENGVMVEVAERKSITQTDLTPILQKRPREVGTEMGVQRNPRLPLPGVRSSGIRSTAASQPLHRPLSAVLGTPKGPIGKAALPQRSPFEERQANQATNWAAVERNAKRQRVAEVGQTWNAAKDIKTPVPKSRALQCERSSGSRGIMAPPLERQTPLANRVPGRTVPHEVVDITSDVEEPMSDVTLPNTPPNLSHLSAFTSGRTMQRPMQRPVPNVRAAVPESRPRPLHRERPPERSPSPPVSTTSKVTGVQEATVLPHKVAKNAEKHPERQSSPQRKTLKLKAGPRKKMLFCQETPQDRDTGVAMKYRSVSRPNDPNVQNSIGPRYVKRTSEIPRLDNGLTPSSPPDEVEDPPEKAAPGEGVGRYRQKVRSDRASKSLPGREAELSNGLERAPTVGRKGQSSTSDVASRAQVSKFRGSNAAPPAAAPDKAASPPYKRRVRSENDHRPNQDKPSTAARPNAGGRTASKGTKKMVQRSTSLQIAVPSKTARRASTPPSPPVDKDVGPWSTEAMDLFDWRPPGYVFQGQGKGFAPAEAQAGDTAVN